MTLRSAVALTLILASSACHGTKPNSKTAGGDQYLIVASELAGTAHNNLYDAVRQLRPGWFTRNTARSGSSEQNINVYVQDRLLGSTANLRRFSSDYPSRVRYLTATDAQIKFGQQNGMRAAIVIETDRP